VGVYKLEILTESVIGEVSLFFLGVLYLSTVVAITFYLGRRKTQTPVICAIIGLGLAFIPPLLAVYIVILLLKSDISKPSVA
jgi:hypothetical protein